MICDDVSDLPLNAPCFSSDYRQARSRFRQAATRAGAQLYSYAVQSKSDHDLTVDVAIIGEGYERALVITSGVHGVEGFFGSALQLAMLQQQVETLQQLQIKIVLVHAVNPYGFAQLRRFNEDNVDLNRNFLLAEERYSGAPAGYRRLNDFLNPQSPPSFELFRLKALWNIWRFGLEALKESVAGGQYDYPEGIFYGGSQACQSSVLVQRHIDSWVGQSESLLHLDLHTGLGAYGSYKLLLSDEIDSPNYRWFADTYGDEIVEPLAATGGTAYSVSGHFGSWMRDHFKQRDYRFAGAEFGTYGVIRVLASIRAENRAYHYDKSGNRAAARELLECFCPADSAWRESVLSAALGVVKRGCSAL